MYVILLGPVCDTCCDLYFCYFYSIPSALLLLQS